MIVALETAGSSARRRENPAHAFHTRGMDPNLSRGARSPREPDSYTRRRVVVFGGALGILGLAAWALSAATGAGRPPHPAAAAPRAAAAAPRGAAAAAPRGAAAAPTTAAPTVTAATRPARTADVSARAHRPGHACAPGDVIISLFVSQQVYQRLTKPQFTIYVVNIGRPVCTFDAGPQSLRLVVKSGQIKSWSSAGCTRGAVTHIVRLPHSVPFIEYLTWNRERSGPGCPSPGAVARPGTYTATVVSGADHSPTEAFVLR
jgi:hypothetical protein